MSARQPIPSLFCCLAVAMLVAVGGCRSSNRDWKFADMFNLKKGMPWHRDDPEIGIPSRVVGTWTDTVLTQSGKVPQRGFGGRLLFYDNESKNPIQVEGQLVVYAFDESRREPTDNRPTRRYVFPLDQVPLHKSESELGPSYSFWLPWDEAGGPQTEVSLICRFEPKDGPLVVGEQTKHLLPGALVANHGPPKLPEGVPFKPRTQQAMYSANNQSSANQMQAASYESPLPNGPVAGATQPAERRMETTSISLPQSFRIQGSAAAVQAGPPPTPSAGSTSDLRRQPGVPAATQPPPQQGNPVGQPASYAPTNMQPITPVGTSALTPPAQQPGMPQAWQQNLQPLPAGMPAQYGLSTTVTVLTPGESARRRWGQPSSGSTPAGLPAPAPPAFQ